MKIYVKKEKFLQQQNNENKRIAVFATLHPWKSIFIMTLPTILAQLILASYLIIDKIIATNFGTKYLISQYSNLNEESARTIINVATGYAGVVFSITFAFSLFIAIGTAIKVSIALGEKNVKKVSDNISTGQILSLTVSIIMAIIMWFLAEPIISFQAGTDGATWNPEMKKIIFDQSIVYSRILTTGIIILFLGNIWVMLLRAEGRLLFIILVYVIGFITNSALDFILVFPFGMIGTAYATALAWVPYAIMPFLYVYFNKTTKLKINIKNMKFNKSLATGIIALGLGVLFENIAQGLLAMFAARILSSLPNPDSYTGSSTVPVYAQINSGIVPWAILINAPIIGIGYGARALVGYNYGAKNYHRIWQIILRLAIFMFACLLVLTIIIVFAGQYMLQIFGVDTEIANKYKIFMIYQFMLISLATVTYVGLILFQSINKSKVALFISSQRTVIVPALCVLIGGILSFKTVNGVYFFITIGLVDLFASIIISPILIYSFNKWKHYLKDNNEKY